MVEFATRLKHRNMQNTHRKTEFQQQTSVTAYFLCVFYTPTIKNHEGRTDLETQLGLGWCPNFLALYQPGLIVHFPPEGVRGCVEGARPPRVYC